MRLVPLRPFSVRLVLIAVLAVAFLAINLVAKPARADFGVRVGVLSCAVDGGAGLIIASRKLLGCNFNAIAVPNEYYDGAITKLGIDIGATGGSHILWAVFAPTLQLSPGALEGRYYGLTAEVTPAVGVGANLLVGGFDRSIILQPLSVQGQVGANVAAGVAQLRLESPPAPVFKR